MTFAPYSCPGQADAALGHEPKLEALKPVRLSRPPGAANKKPPLFFPAPAPVKPTEHPGGDLAAPPPADVRLGDPGVLARGRRRGGDASPSNGFNRLLPGPRPGRKTRVPKVSHSLESGTGARPRARAGPGNSAGLPGFRGRRRLRRHLSACSATGLGRDCDG